MAAQDEERPQKTSTLCQSLGDIVKCNDTSLKPKDDEIAKKEGTLSEEKKVCPPPRTAVDNLNQPKVFFESDLILS